VSGKDFSVVAKYRDVILAETAQELLETAGIEARVLTAGMDPLYSFSVEWVTVVVRETDLIEARALLRALLTRLDFGPPAPGFGLQSDRWAGSFRNVPRCRACGSPATVPVPGAGRLVWMALRMFRPASARFGPPRRCLACGHVGRAEREGAEEPLPPAFERAIAAYESGLKRRLVAAIRRVAAHKVREAARAAARAEAERRRKAVAMRYEAVREAAVAAVAASLDTDADRDLLAAQADLSWDEIVALERRPDALTGPARRVLLRLATEARRRGDLSDS
jgi:hypothetical protein